MAAQRHGAKDLRRRSLRQASLTLPLSSHCFEQLLQERTKPD
jgi:hypothetical protein